jgi:hypothetical protein
MAHVDKGRVNNTYALHVPDERCLRCCLELLWSKNPQGVSRRTYTSDDDVSDAAECSLATKQNL